MTAALSTARKSTTRRHTGKANGGSAEILPFLARVERIDMPVKAPGRVATLSPDEARTLTTNIKHAVVKLWVLVAEAHDRGAHTALGYETWADYVVRELQMSESTSYNYLDQARIMRTLVSAGVDINDIEPPPVRVVQRIKDNLPSVRRAAKRALEAGQPIEEALRDLAESLKPAIEPRPRTSSRVIEGAIVPSTETPPSMSADLPPPAPAPASAPLDPGPLAAPFSAAERVDAVKAEMPRGEVLCPACGGQGRVKRKLAALLEPALAALR